MADYNTDTPTITLHLVVAVELHDLFMQLMREGEYCSTAEFLEHLLWLEQKHLAKLR